MISAEIRWAELDDADALRVRHIDLGRSRDRHSTPYALCLLSLNAEPIVRAVLRRTSEETYPFCDAQYWHGWFVIGWGHAFYLINVETNAVIHHELGTYFGYIHANESLLIASAERVVRVSSAGGIAWTSERVGIDGVTVSSVGAIYIEGSGEWDPPGGWKPFRLRLVDGCVVSGGKPGWYFRD